MPAFADTGHAARDKMLRAARPVADEAFSSDAHVVRWDARINVVSPAELGPNAALHAQTIGFSHLRPGNLAMSAAVEWSSA